MPSTTHNRYKSGWETADHALEQNQARPYQRSSDLVRISRSCRDYGRGDPQSFGKAFIKYPDVSFCVGALKEVTTKGPSHALARQMDVTCFGAIQMIQAARNRPDLYPS
jgi:hypothetical protein